MTARDPAFVAALRTAMRGEVRAEEPLARYSTYRIGGPATISSPASAEDVAIALRHAHAAGTGWFALGLGSNVLLPDEGLDALVVRMGKGVDGLSHEGDCWRLGAGLPGPLAARRTAEAGYAGLHKFVGVPGTVGGGVYMNAGCHGGEWAALVDTITVVEESGHDRILRREQVPFRYRRSGLGACIVVEATVQLPPDDPKALAAEMAELFRWRSEGTPFNQPCCGSVFQNPGGPSWEQREGPRTAGQLIEAAGLKGFQIGGAQVSLVHANYFVNLGGATAADVRALIVHVREAVFDRFGVRLEPEVKVMGSNGALRTAD